MNKGKKIALISIASIIGVFALLVILRLMWPYITTNYENPDPEGKDSIDHSIDYLNNDVSFQMFLYGKDIEFRDSFEYRKIDKLSDDNLKSDADYIYLIINDLDGDMNLTKEDIKYLKEYADGNNSFNFYYLGTDKLDLFSLDIFGTEGFADGDRSIGYVCHTGTRMLHGGMWTDTEVKYMDVNTEMLQQSVLYTIELIIRTNE